MIVAQAAGAVGTGEAIVFWILGPIALAGAVLLFTGATYERRMRDLRRMRRIIGCMR